MKLRGMPVAENERNRANFIIENNFDFDTLSLKAL
jgi:hypothetical protein